MRAIHAPLLFYVSPIYQVGCTGKTIICHPFTGWQTPRKNTFVSHIGAVRVLGALPLFLRPCFRAFRHLIVFLCISSFNRALEFLSFSVNTKKPSCLRATVWIDNKTNNIQHSYFFRVINSPCYRLHLKIKNYVDNVLSYDSILFISWCRYRSRHR